MDWAAVSAIVLSAFLLFELTSRVIIPWCKKPRLLVICPDGSTTCSEPRNNEATITAFIKHTGGALKTKGRASEELWAYCNFHPSFNIIEANYADTSPETNVSENPPVGDLAEYKYIVAGPFWLPPGDAERVSVKVRTPSKRDVYSIYYQFVEGPQRKYLGRYRLSITVH